MQHHDERDPELQHDIDGAWEHLEAGELDDALRAYESARAAAPHEPAVYELEVELHLSGHDPEAARDACRRWSEDNPDDPEPWLTSAEVSLRYGEPKKAARHLRELLAEFLLDPHDEADARHLLGMACEERGDYKGMLAEWLAVLRLDTANDGPESVISHEHFERIAADALDELPPEVLVHLQNVPIIVEDRPSEALVLEGLDPRTLGLFQGILAPSSTPFGPEAGIIHLFQRNLERDALNRDDLAEQIRITVLHETAHYFGATEDDLRRFGLN